MLKFLRQKKTIKILLWILAVVVIVAFVLWGAPTRLGQRQSTRPKYAGEIFGKKILFNDFIKAYQASRNQAIMTYGQQFQKYAQFINLEEDAWNRLILLKTAKDKKIKVTNEEVIQKIKSFPFFQKDGNFDLETYKLVLKYVFRMVPVEFEEQIRNSLLIEKLVEQSLALVNITEKELEQAYSKENDTARVTYILIKEEDFKNDIKISKESLEKFYQKNKENFKKPQQVNVKYIKVDFSSQKGKVNVTEEEIKDYYREHKEEFKITAEEEKKNEGAPAYQTLDEVKERIKDIILANKAQEKALELAYEVSDFLYEGKSLEEASQKFSLPIAETGFFSSLESIPEVGWSYQFLMAAFKLEKGQISDIVQTPKGYYILQLIAKKEPYVPPLDEIKKRVTDAFIKEKAKAKAKEKAENMLAVLKKEKNKENFNFVQAAKTLGFTAQSTKSFKRDDYIPNIGQSKEFTEKVFKLEVGEISGIIEVPKGYVILKVDEKKPFDRKKFTEEKESFKNRLLAQKRQKYFLEWFKNLKEKANLKNNLSSMPKE